MNDATMHLVAGERRWCDSCNTTTKRPVYAYDIDPTDPIEVATHCPNCPPEDAEEDA